MKKCLVAFLFVFSSFGGFSQTNNQLFEMINTSWGEYIKIQKEHRTNTAQKESTAHTFDNTYIAMENYPLGFEFSAQVRDAGFKTIYLQSCAAKKLLKKPRAVVFMVGPNLEDNTLTITLSSRTVVLKNNQMSITATSWMKCRWMYSCDAEKWELVGIESGGV